MILRVELSEAVPAELELALAARHELAATCTYNHHVAARTLLRAE
jgi:hypothetical protein